MQGRQCMRIYEICSKYEIFEIYIIKLTNLVFVVVFASVCVLLESF